MSNKIRWGILGTGSMASDFASATLCAVVSATEDPLLVALVATVGTVNASAPGSGRAFQASVILVSAQSRLA